MTSAAASASTFPMISSHRERTECSLLKTRSNMTQIASIVAVTFLGVFAHAPAGAQQSSQQAPVPAPAQPAPPPPFANRANEVLPSWLRVRGEFRERMEGFTGGGFTAERDELYWLSRFRFNATVTPNRLLAFTVQAQDARVAKKTAGPTGAPFKGTFDLRAAYADLGDAKTAVAARVGRQELVYGEQRLIGHVGWVNTARTFDAARVTLRMQKFTVDLFGASVVRILDDEFDKSGNGNQFYGAYGSTGALVPKSTIEPYFLWKRDRNLTTELATTGNLELATVGVRWVGKLLARIDYGTELALQAGSLGSDDVDAWAGHWQVRVGAPTAVPLGFTGEYNYASGDADPGDGTRGTFDQLYPTGHEKYGLADQIGWRNIHHLRTGVDLAPIKNLLLTANYHSWWLAEPRDALYTAGSAVLARVAASADSHHVGQEIDVQTSRPITPQLQLSGGYAYIFPGAFLKQSTPGSGYGYPYVMATYVFLAER